MDFRNLSDMILDQSGDEHLEIKYVTEKNVSLKLEFVVTNRLNQLIVDDSLNLVFKSKKNYQTTISEVLLNPYMNLKFVIKLNISQFIMCLTIIYQNQTYYL